MTEIQKFQINLLGLEDKVITIPKTAPAAEVSLSHNLKFRSSTFAFFYFILNFPLLPILLPAILHEPFKRANPPSMEIDEGVDLFLTRRVDETFAPGFGSALVYGIYATESRKLSVWAAFPSIWDV
jgi:oxygen-dependent protoporphyrinogen oxidase